MSERRLEKIISSYIPMPVCIINRLGKVVEANSRIGEVFLYDGIGGGDIFALTGIRAADLYEAAEKDQHPLLKRNDKIFRLMLQKGSDVKGEDDGDLTIVFNDVTGLEDLKDRYNNEKICMAKIQVDNYDELASSTSTEKRLILSSEIDRLIRRWCGKVNASVNQVRNNAYVVWFEQQYLERLISNKFDILDEIRNVETGADFPASLSIGVGVGGRNPSQTEEYADC